MEKVKKIGEAKVGKTKEKLWPGWKGFFAQLGTRKLALWIALIGLVADQASKLAIQLTIPYHMGVTVFSKLFGFIDFKLVHSLNTGVAWGFLRDVPGINFVFMAITTVAILMLIGWLAVGKDLTKGMVWGLGLVLSGAIGNLLDRIIVGGVVDFLDFTIGTYHYPTFNVADACVVVGVGLLILATIRAEIRARKKS
ncbi:signal peptidase II [bacterium]|nr:signal peptidase II [bacterium]